MKKPIKILTAMMLFAASASAQTPGGTPIEPGDPDPDKTESVGLYHGAALGFRMRMHHGASLRLNGIEIISENHTIIT